MALNEESRALLQLLLIRGKGYDEIAELLGVERDEVARRAGVALNSLGSGDAPIDPVVTDYMLGQADPIGRAEAVRALTDDPVKAGACAEVRDQLVLLFPEAEIPEPPGGGGKVPPSKARARRQPAPLPETAKADSRSGEDSAASAGRAGGLDGRSRTILAALVAAVGLAAIVAVVILLSGGGAEQEIADEPPGRTVAALRAPQGEEGRGKVEFGFAGERFAANINLSDLSANGENDGYALWLQGPAGSFPFDSAKVGNDGTITGRSEISQAIICFIAADLFTEVKVSRVGDAELTKTLRRAVNRNVREADFPDYVGETVLAGPISMPLESREQIIEACGGRRAATSGGNQGS